LNAEEIGAGGALFQRSVPVEAAEFRDGLLADFESSKHPYLLIDPGPGLRIVGANPAYLAATFTERDSIAGRSLFDVFPDNPDQPLADGVNNLFISLKTVAATGRPHGMAIQRYDIRDAAGIFVERHWLPLNTPIHDTQGRLVFLLHQVEDVTDQVAPPPLSR
jgi:PAS domain-containing protein